MLPIITQDTIDLAPGTYIKLPATIAEYEQLVKRMGDRAAIRVRFRNDQIQLMAPLPEHGNQTDVLSDLIKSILRFQARDWHGFGFPTIAIQALIPQFVERAWAIGSSAALREFEQVLRQTND